MGQHAANTMHAFKAELIREVVANSGPSVPKIISLISFDNLKTELSTNPLSCSWPTGEVHDVFHLRFTDIIGWRVIIHINSSAKEVFIYFLHRISSTTVTVKNTVDEMKREFGANGIP